MADEATGRAAREVAACDERRVRAHRRAADERVAAQRRQVRADAAAHVTDLHRDLARGRDDEGLRAAAGVRLKRFERDDREHAGLARARLRLRDQVDSEASERDRFRLDGRGADEAVVGDAAEHRVGDGQVLEGEALAVLQHVRGHMALPLSGRRVGRRGSDGASCWGARRSGAPCSQQRTSFKHTTKPNFTDHTFRSKLVTG